MKRIVVLNVDGTETVLEKNPDLKEMQAIVGGYIEHCQVMDRLDDDGNIVMTSMFVNEEGLLDELPKNEKATEIYQRNIRHQFPGPDPFKRANAAMRQAYGSTLIEVPPPPSAGANYRDDPWIAGPAIFYEGYTCNEVNALSGDGDEADDGENDKQTENRNA